jgi:hypothetical protein
MKKTSAIAALFFVAIALAAPFAAFGETGDGGVGSGQPEKQNFQIVPCDGVDNPTTTKVETECDFKMLMVGVSRVMKFLLFLSIPLVMGMMIYTAYKFMTAGGDAGKLADAKKMFVPVVLGLFWIMAAYLIVYTFIEKLVNPEIKGEAQDAIKILDNTKK